MENTNAVYARVVELELRFTEQQDVIQQLSDVVYAQARALEQLEKDVTQLKKKLEGEPGLVDAKQHERPPHY